MGLGINYVILANHLVSICCKDWLAWNQDIVFEPSDIFSCGLLFYENLTKHVSLVQSEQHNFVEM